MADRPGSASPDRERNTAIYVAVVDGATFGELAERYGISRVRVQKAYARERTNAWEARRRGETSYLDRPIPADV
jgi:transposase